MKKSVVHSQRMPEELYKKAKKAADNDSRSLSQWINLLIRDKVNTK